MRRGRANADLPHRTTKCRMHLRQATTDDADSLARVINAAYRVEDFFKIGDRIDAAGVSDEMGRGTFLVLEDDHGLAWCVYVEVTAELGYIGLLSVDPARQGQGHGSTLLRAAEQFCRGAGCRTMEIQSLCQGCSPPPRT